MTKTAMQLLDEATHAAWKGMHALAASKAKEAAKLFQLAADEKRMNALGDITEECLPSYLRRQAE